MIEITEEMLDAIEAVKGRREPQYWDHQCRRYMEKQKNLNNLSEEIVFDCVIKTFFHSLGV